MFSNNLFVGVHILTYSYLFSFTIWDIVTVRSVSDTLIDIAYTRNPFVVHLFTSIFCLTEFKSSNIIARFQLLIKTTDWVRINIKWRVRMAYESNGNEFEFVRAKQMSTQLEWIQNRICTYEWCRQDGLLIREFGTCFSVSRFVCLDRRRLVKYTHFTCLPSKILVVICMSKRIIECVRAWCFYGVNIRWIITVREKATEETETKFCSRSANIVIINQMNNFIPFDESHVPRSKCYDS